jgi:hypothetical protein
MIYRKRGSVVRWENGTLVRVAERGIAIEEGELFECRPDDSGEVPRVDELRVIEAVDAVRMAAGDVAIERLIVVEGIAEHVWTAAAAAAAFVCDTSAPEHTKAAAAAAAVQRTEHTQRIHLSLMRGRIRALVDLGSFDTTDVARIAAALARAEAVEREAPPRLRLAPNVTAALLPTLIGIAPPLDARHIRLLQTAGGVDGYGDPIVEASGPWPNVYRPSYRVPPVRMPMQLRLECDVTEIEEDRPIAVALLAPVSSVLRVLIDDGRRAYPSAVRVTRIDAVSGRRTWYPYGGGSFGAEMML